MAARNRGVGLLGPQSIRAACRYASSHSVEVVADGDLALLAALFPEPQDALVALVLEVPAAQSGEGADTGPGVGEGSQEGAVAEADDMGDVEGA